MLHPAFQYSSPGELFTQDTKTSQLFVSNNPIVENNEIKLAFVLCAYIRHGEALRNGLHKPTHPATMTMTPVEMLKKLQETSSKMKTSTVDTKIREQQICRKDEQPTKKAGAHYIPGEGWSYMSRVTSHDN